MTENAPEMAQPIANEAGFVNALGINPGIVKRGSINITFEEGKPVVSLTLMLPVDFQTLAGAFMAGAGAPPESPPAVKQPEDHKKPVKKAATRRRTPKKAVEEAPGE